MDFLCIGGYVLEDLCYCMLVALSLLWVDGGGLPIFLRRVRCLNWFFVVLAVACRWSLAC